MMLRTSIYKHFLLLKCNKSSSVIPMNITYPLNTMK